MHQEEDDLGKIQACRHVQREAILGKEFHEEHFQGDLGSD